MAALKTRRAPSPPLPSIDSEHTCSFLRRDKEHSTIIYESPTPDTPLLRLGWNRQDPRYMATLLMDSSKVVVLDIRCAPGLDASVGSGCPSSDSS
jgi:hypothetical protein